MRPRKYFGTRTCPQCGKEWDVTKHNQRNRYCSPACRGMSQRKTETRYCTACGKPFVVRTQSDRRCCSSECKSQRTSDTHTERHMNKPPGTPDYSNRKDGRREDLGGQYFRSSWEANIARYLNFLKDKGEIDRWEYEPDTFWFEKIRRGVRSYRPDFKIWDTPDSEPYYWEVKGYDYARGITARKRMAKYYPKVKLVVIDEVAYRAIKKWRALIPGWE